MQEHMDEFEKNVLVQLTHCERKCEDLKAKHERTLDRIEKLKAALAEIARASTAEGYEEIARQALETDKGLNK